MSGEKNTNLSEKVDTFLNPFIPSYTPGAAIAIIENGDIVYTNGYGMSDINNMEPVILALGDDNHISVQKNDIGEYFKILYMIVDKICL